MKRFVVGMDGSTGSTDALLWAAALADAASAELVAATAFRPDQSEVAPDDMARMRDEQHRVLDTVWVEPARALRPVRSLVADGDPREALVAVADDEDADLLVIGATGSASGVGFLHLGSVAEHLVHHTTRPLALVPEGARGPVRRIVLGVDGSTHNESAVRFTADLAHALGALVCAVAVEEPILEWTPATSPDNWRRGVEADIRERWAAPISHAGVEVEAVALRGMNPATGLLDEAARVQADLVIVGTRGLGGITGLRAGGVAIKVAHHAGRPVVLVPTGAR